MLTQLERISDLVFGACSARTEIARAGAIPSMLDPKGE